MIQQMHFSIVHRRVVFLKSLFTLYKKEKAFKKMSEEVEAHILKKYSLTKKVGSGAYGHVWRVTDRKTTQTLALKKIFDAFQHSTDAQRTFRQIVFLHDLDHPNIIKLHNVIRAQNDKDLYLVFQYMEADLHNAIGQKILKDIHNRFIIYQVVRGIKFLHSAQLIHRDLKPSNVLLNSDCHLKICDFGLARSLIADKEGSDMVLTEEVATRWYRAPEVLLGSQTYDKSADIWSIGCILGEMLIGKPMFPGNSTLNQLERILSFTGKPSKEDVYSLNSEIAISMINSINSIKVKPIKQWFKNDTPADALSLISKMLEFNPTKRPTACEILSHPYLAKFHSPKDEYDSPKIIYPPISDNKKLSLKQYRQLIYDRIKKIYKSPEEEIKNTSGSMYRHGVQSKSSSAHKEQTQYTPVYQSQSSVNPGGSHHRHSTGKMKNTGYSFTSHQDSEEKIQKKSSLKEILKNKRSREELQKTPSNISNSNYVQKYYRKSGMSTAAYKENKLGKHG